MSEKEFEDNGDLYKVLGVGKFASKEEIKKAYKKLAKEHHPDTQNGDEEMFKKIVEAYNVLTDDEMRAIYDKTGQKEKMPDDEKVIEFLRVTIIPSILNSPNVYEKDVIKALTMYIQDNIDTHVEQIQYYEKEIVKLSGVVDRFVVKNGKPNVFREVIKEMIADKRNHVTYYQSEIKFYRYVLEFVKDYEYIMGDLLNRKPQDDDDRKNKEIRENGKVSFNY